MKKGTRTTSDALEILDRRYFRSDPRRARALADSTLNARIAQEIHRLRVDSGFTQKQLANLVGTTHTVISRLEDADYTGHSLKMLQRISAALNQRLEVHFVPLGPRRKATA
jgi:ribosome-binding protein aMBF1 (putative translation factor)